MKARLSALIVLLCAACPLLAQEVNPSKKISAVEIGAGYQPIHATLLLTDSDISMTDEGKRLSRDGRYYPTFSLSGIWRAGERTEIILAFGISWCESKVIQYGTFGIDPEGKPRYNLNDPNPAGWKASGPIPVIDIRYRNIWNPGSIIVLYTGMGLGTMLTMPLPLLEITPLGVRFGGRHIYGFAEATLGPLASFGHGGIGWKF